MYEWYGVNPVNPVIDCAAARIVLIWLDASPVLFLSENSDCFFLLLR